MKTLLHNQFCKTDEDEFLYLFNNDYLQASHTDDPSKILIYIYQDRFKLSHIAYAPSTNKVMLFSYFETIFNEDLKWFLKRYKWNEIT